MRRLGVEYDCDIHSCGKLIGSTPESFIDYIRLSYVARNGDQSFNHYN